MVTLQPSAVALMVDIRTLTHSVTKVRITSTISSRLIYVLFHSEIYVKVDSYFEVRRTSDSYVDRVIRRRTRFSSNLLVRKVRFAAQNYLIRGGFSILYFSTRVQDGIRVNAEDRRTEIIEWMIKGELTENF